MTVQRIKRIDQALKDWAYWRVAASGGYRSPSFEFHGNGHVFGDQVVVISADQERAALLMDRAVSALPGELKKTVVAAYTWQGGVDVICEKLRVTRATVHRRLCHSDLRIDDWLVSYDDRRNRYHRQPVENNFASYTD